MRFQKVDLARMLYRSWPKARWIGMLAGLVAVAMIPVVGKALLQNAPRDVPEPINRLPDRSDQEKMRQQQNGQQNFGVANTARKKQVSEDTEKLLMLATDLKAEIDKTNKDTLSLVAIRKAGAIEKLARNIKDQMKLALRSN